MRVSEHADYMHFNTLSMVGSDDRENRRGRSLSATGIRRNRSWVATLKDIAVGDRSDGRNPLASEGTKSPQRLRLRRSTPSLKGPNNGVVVAPQQALGLTSLKTESKPNHTRVAPSKSKSLPEGQSNAITTRRSRRLSTKGEGSEIGVNGTPDSSVTHIRFTETRSGDPFSDQDENDKASIGRGRLTMTSRTGYFQDRIIPPSMVGFFWNFFRLSSLGYQSSDLGLDARYGDIIPFEQESGFQRGLSGIPNHDAKRDPSTIPEGVDAMRRERPVCGRQHHLCGAITRVKKGAITGTRKKDG